MKTTLTPLDPADFIGPAPVAEPDPSLAVDAPADAAAVWPGAESADATSTAAEASSGPDGAGPSDDDETAAERFVGPRVKLTVEIDAETFDADVEAAYRKLAREVRIPGFRPGRAPRRVLESHFGTEIGRVQALEDALPRYYAEAVRDNGVDVVNQPELDITEDGTDGPVAFEATVETRPVVAITGYDELQVEIPSPVPSEDEISSRIDDTRHHFADLAEVDRPAAEGDRVRIDIEGSVDGNALPGLSAQDYLYELGSGGIVAEVDEHLTGCVAGDELSFSAPHPVHADREIDFEIAVGAVSELVLPELTDDWVDENTEHDSVAEMREATARQLSFGLIMQANLALRDEVQQQIAGLVGGPVPDAMVSGTIADRMTELGSGLQQRNMTLEEWLEANGQEPMSFISQMRDDAERGVRLDLALRALAAAEGLVAEDDDIDSELERMADDDGRSADELRQVLTEADGLAHLTSSICKSKALRWAIEAAALVGPDGEAIDREALELPGLGDTGDDSDTGDDGEDASEAASTDDDSQHSSNDSDEDTP